MATQAWRKCWIAQKKASDQEGRAMAARREARVGTGPGARQSWRQELAQPPWGACVADLQE